MKLEEALAVLGLSRSADLAAIKKRYRALALEFHPDKSKSADAHERFIKIKDAYELACKIRSKTVDGDAFYAAPSAKPECQQQFFSAWTLDVTESHIIIKVPKLEQNRSTEIVIFGFNDSQPKIRLPINCNYSLKKHIVSELARFLPMEADWPVLHASDVEIMLRLRSNKSDWPEILEVIFNAYKFPQKIVSLISSKLKIERSSHHNLAR